MQGNNIETRVGIFVLLALVVLAYMGFQIGALRFDRGQYENYLVCFKDISGLSRKADVKIAGVKVGWVESVDLSPGSAQACAKIMVKKAFGLRSGAYAIVRQDGLLGPKYVEIVPGDPLLPLIDPGNTIGVPGVEQVSVDELMRNFKQIATNVIGLTDSIKTALGSDGKSQLGSLVKHANNTFQEFSQVGAMLSKTLARNEQNIDELLSIGKDIKGVTNALQENVLPSFQVSIEKISNVFDRDFDRVASHLTVTADSLNEFSQKAQAGITRFNSIVEKIDNGQGLVGKLINEDETYSDLKSAIKGFKSYINRVERMEIVFDSHFEAMHRSAENYQYEDSKGYFDVRIHPNEDHFYIVQIAASQKGDIDRKETLYRYIDENLDPIDLDKLNLDGYTLVNNVFRNEKTKLRRNTIKIGLQFGKVFGEGAAVVVFGQL